MGTNRMGARPPSATGPAPAVAPTVPGQSPLYRGVDWPAWCTGVAALLGAGWRAATRGVQHPVRVVAVSGGPGAHRWRRETWVDPAGPGEGVPALLSAAGRLLQQLGSEFEGPVLVALRGEADDLVPLLDGRARVGPGQVGLLDAHEWLELEATRRFSLEVAKLQQGTLSGAVGAIFANAALLHAAGGMVVEPPEGVAAGGERASGWQKLGKDALKLLRERQGAPGIVAAPVPGPGVATAAAVGPLGGEPRRPRRAPISIALDGPDNVLVPADVSPWAPEAGDDASSNPFRQPAPGRRRRGHRAPFRSVARIAEGDEVGHEGDASDEDGDDPFWPGADSPPPPLRRTFGG